MPDEQEQPAPRVHKKAVHLEFEDIAVHVETEDELSVLNLHQLCIDTMSFLIEERIKYSGIFDAEPDSGDMPHDTTKTLVPAAELQKLESRGMYQ